jgi:PIN domain nuclease of toxin-antitoxin system
VVADRERCPQKASGKVKILLDTNALIWWMEDNPRLGPRARAQLANPNHSVISSIVSIWEITMKWRAGKHPVSGTPYARFTEDERIPLLSITADHVAAVETLDFHHKDPFDHLILAQAKVEGATIITSDGDMPRYGVPCLDCR